MPVCYILPPFGFDSHPRVRVLCVCLCVFVLCVECLGRVCSRWRRVLSVVHVRLGKRLRRGRK